MLRCLSCCFSEASVAEQGAFPFVCVSIGTLSDILFVLFWLGAIRWRGYAVCVKAISGFSVFMVADDDGDDDLCATISWRTGVYGRVSDTLVLCWEHGDGWPALWQTTVRCVRLFQA